jgi:hypothetical protein
MLSREGHLGRSRLQPSPRIRPRQTRSFRLPPPALPSTRHRTLLLLRRDLAQLRYHVSHLRSEHPVPFRVLGVRFFEHPVVPLLGDLLGSLLGHVEPLGVHFNVGACTAREFSTAVDQLDVDQSFDPLDVRDAGLVRRRVVAVCLLAFAPFVHSSIEVVRSADLYHAEVSYVPEHVYVAMFQVIVCQILLHDLFQIFGNLCIGHWRRFVRYEVWQIYLGDGTGALSGLCLGR